MLGENLTIHKLRETLTETQIQEFIASLSDKEAELLMYDWRFWARANQILPDWAWRFALALCGRGFGKTRMGSEWVIERAKAGKGPIILIGQTASDVRDVMVENGPSSIIACSPPDFMPIYEPSKRRLTWPNGVTATTFSGDEPGQLRGPQSQCFVAGTKILMGDGSEKSVEDVSVGDTLLTRYGVSEVEAVRSYTTQVGMVRFSNGRTLVGTYDHPIYGENTWISMINLKKWQNVSTGYPHKMGTQLPTKTTNTTGSIGGFGSNLLGLFLKIMTYITRMRTGLTIGFQILNYSLKKNIGLNTLLNKLIEFVKTAGLSLPAENKKAQSVYVKNASIRERILNVKHLETVRSVGRSFSQDLEHSVASVVSTWEDVGNETVYSLQVSNEQEYIANNIVVHNTAWVDELPKFDNPQEAFDQMSFGLRIGDARALITTTPTPHKLIKELYLDAINNKTLTSGAKRVHLITGSTMENEANLDPDALDDMKAKYEGTRLGEQELHGKILWEAEDALWKQTEIDSFRVEEKDVPHFSMSCIAVDPTVGDPGKTQIDECGIMAGGLGLDGHGYLTGDHTIKATPAQWAGKIAGLLALGIYDFVVAEKNNGGLLVTETLKSYGVPESRIVLVHASQGKLVRAEPVSLLSEQGKIHHVGEYVQLEQELVCYEGKGKSPNRLDAFVWLFTFLMLGKVDRSVSVRTKRF